MKRLFKVLVNTLAILMLFVCMSTMLACGETTTSATITVDVNGEDKTLVMNLDSNLAPKTVEQIKKLIDAKFYDGALFYVNSSFTSQVMFGDIKYENDEIKQILTADNKLPETVIGEFENAGRTGSTVKNVDGSIGLWRTWIGTSSSGYKYSTATNTGRSTIYMPTGEITSYDGYFCIFAQLDLEDSTTSANWTAIKEAVTTSEVDDYENYYVYYTKSEEDTEPVFHCVKSSDYKAPDDLYSSSSDSYYCYSKYTIKVPVKNVDDVNVPAVSIKSIVLD